MQNNAQQNEIIRETLFIILFKNMQKKNLYGLPGKRQIIASLYFALVSVCGFSQDSIFKSKDIFSGFAGM